MEKTNAMRKLSSLKITYKEYEFEAKEAVSGTEVAKIIGKDPARVFKTLVTTGKTGTHYVFMVPVAEELDLKKAALAVGEKSIEMLKSKDLLSLTGYVHGGCSPVGMKKLFHTTIHSTAEDFETMIFSGGRIGCQIELNLDALSKAITFELADIIK
jgi:Cys-tRNA(Pro)/Cys-tRNA(Cys) deacylase